MSNQPSALPLKKSISLNKNTFVSKNELLSWINELLKVNLTLVEQLGSGTMFCQILDVIYPGQVPLTRVKWGAKLEYDFMSNFKILQQTFDKLSIQKAIPINKLVKAKCQDNLEFAQWMKAYFDQNCKDKGKSYDAIKRRGNVTPYFGFCKGGVLPKQTLFYRNPNEKFTADDFSNSSFSSQHEQEFHDESISSNNVIPIKSDENSNINRISLPGSLSKAQALTPKSQPITPKSQAITPKSQQSQLQQPQSFSNTFFKIKDESSNHSEKEFFSTNEQIDNNQSSFFMKNDLFKTISCPDQKIQNSSTSFFLNKNDSQTDINFGNKNQIQTKIQQSYEQQGYKTLSNSMKDILQQKDSFPKINDNLFSSQNHENSNNSIYSNSSNNFNKAIQNNSNDNKSHKNQSIIENCFLNQNNTSSHSNNFFNKEQQSSNSKQSLQSFQSKLSSILNAKASTQPKLLNNQEKQQNQQINNQLLTNNSDTDESDILNDNINFQDDGDNEIHNKYETPICKKQKLNEDNNNFSKTIDQYNQKTIQLNNQDNQNTQVKEQKCSINHKDIMIGKVNTNQEKIQFILNIIQSSKEDYDSAVQQIQNIFQSK